MKRMLSLWLLVSIVLTFVGANFGVVYAATEVSVTLNGQAIDWEGFALPYEENNEVMLPLKKIVSVLGGTYQEVEVQNQQRVVVLLNSKALLVIINSKEYAVTNIIEIDGKFTYDQPQTYFLDKATVEMNGEVFFPLGHFCAAFGITIKKTENSVDFIIENAVEDNLTLLNDIQTLYKNKQYAECILICDQLLSNDETMMEGYYFKAISYFSLEDINNAFKTLMKQLSFNPKNELALYNGACAASLLGKEQEAIGLIEQLLKLDITAKSSIRNDEDFDNIRNSDRYKKLMEISVIIGGELLTFDVAPIIIEGRTLLPLRKVFEALDAEVSYIDETQTVIAKKGDFTLSLVIGSKTALVNGVEKELDVPAMIRNDRTLVPIRFVGESLKAKVDWDEENQAINIYTPAPIGNLDYDTAKKQMDAVVAVSVIDGAWPEPYRMPVTEGATLIIFKDKKGLDLFNSLSEENRSKYVADIVYENYALVVGCEPVFAKIIYDGKSFYEGEFLYDKKDKGMNLVYYEKGKPVNVVKQYKAIFNYNDFYLLPPSEQTTSKIGEKAVTDNLPIDTKTQNDVDISTAKETVTLDGVKCSLEATITCMDMTKTSEGYSMLAGISIFNNNDNITSDVYVGRIWISQGTEVKSGSINSQNNVVDHALYFSSNWETGSFVDVVVEVKDSSGKVELVKATKIKIKTMVESLQDLLGPDVIITIGE